MAKKPEIHLWGDIDSKKQISNHGHKIYGTEQQIGQLIMCAMHDHRTIYLIFKEAVSQYEEHVLNATAGQAEDKSDE